MRIVSSIARKIVAFLRSVERAMREESVHAIEQELKELESAFLLMILGSFVGVRTMTPLLSLELLEGLQEEVELLRERAFKGEDVIGEVASALGGGT
ncbi:MAG: hypothetical protein NZ902_01070 [Acidilobaceae archaeon]|nr:hypothetical protein [Acidilobaceae archaeon]MCX8165418.1 hypothetical protein [Acidilobaceae archaeon]MDW7973845.1 hypothetical protein [Sulfolobales archaeon]